MWLEPKNHSFVWPVPICVVTDFGLCLEKTFALYCRGHFYFTRPMQLAVPFFSASCIKSRRHHIDICVVNVFLWRYHCCQCTLAKRGFTCYCMWKFRLRSTVPSKKWSLLLARLSSASIVARESWKSTQEAFEWHDAKLSSSLASGVLSQLPKCILNSIDARLNHGPFLLEHWLPLLLY